MLSMKKKGFTVLEVPILCRRIFPNAAWIFSTFPQFRRKRPGTQRRKLWQTVMRPSLWKMRAPCCQRFPISEPVRAKTGTLNRQSSGLWTTDRGGRYFLEAEEGMGMQFRDMVSSFRVVPLDRIAHEWMRSLYETTERLFPALLSNDLSGVSDLLAEDADADAYGENVWDHLTVASVDYAPDNDQDPSSAIVSVKHRLNLEEGESYYYLTMKLVRQDDQWRLAWSGIEK